MLRRPLCLASLFLLLFMCILDRAGFPIVTGNPLSRSMQEWIEEHPSCTIRGEVSECRDTDTSFSVSLIQVCLIVGSEKIPIENVNLYLKSNTDLKVGNVIEAAGRLAEIEGPRNPGEFDAKQYYACRHTWYTMKKAVVLKRSAEYSVYGEILNGIRSHLTRILEKSASDQAGVFEAMLLGEKTNLDADLKLRYQMAGMIHILAISGVHISLIGIGLFELLGKTGIGMVLSGFASLFVMLQYGILTGGSVSAMRAVCMFCLMIGARILGRSYDLLTALSLSAMLLLVDSPAYIRSSSFLLSFGAVAGLGSAAPVLYDLFGAEGKWAKSLLSSAAVQLCTLPFMLAMYGEVSIAGLFLNLIVLPTVGVVLGSGLACSLAGCLSLKLAWAAAIPGRALLIFYEYICRFVGRIPFCTWIAGAPDFWQSTIYYVLLILGLVISALLKSRPKRVVSFLFTVSAAVLILSLHQKTDLNITCLDVGQGDGIVVSVPDGGTVLIDCGSTSKSKTGQYQLLPYLKHEGISYVDAIVVSHTDEDHISGVRELLSFLSGGLTGVRVGKLIMPGVTARSKNFEELLYLAENAGVPVYFANAGDVLKVGEAEFSVLAPADGAKGTDVNEDSLVTELHYKNFSALFCGDIPVETEKALAGSWEDVDFLKVAHHGSRYSTCESFLNEVRPEISVISCSSTNTYGHPSPQTIERLENAGSRICCTKDDGAVTVTTDGQKMWAETYCAD